MSKCLQSLYPPQYNFDPLLEALHQHKSIIEHTKYKNNFDYNYALLILNKEPYLANGAILLLENEAIPSRIASLHYEYYHSMEDLRHKITSHEDAIQCVVSQDELFPGTISFGKAQEPELWDYADGVDTMKFLLSL